MYEKKQFVKDLKKDEIVNDVFVVKFKKPVEQYRKGYRFEMRLGDSSKEIMYKFWGPDDEELVRSLYNTISKGDVVFIQGRINEWNNKLEISANNSHTLKPLQEGEYNPSDFIQRTEKDIQGMWNELMHYVDSVEDNDLKAVLDEVFKNEDTAKKFRQSPAAMYIHHGWIGGLLEHTLDVTKITENLASIHSLLDRDFVITGSLLHDLGKLKEFETTTSINVTTEGMMIGHVSIAVKMLSDIMDRIKTPEEKRIKLLHIILTHMGEYGSSKTPSTPEALAIYYADQTNAQLVHMLSLKEDANTEDDYIYNKDFGNIYLK